MAIFFWLSKIYDFVALEKGYRMSCTRKMVPSILRRKMSGKVQQYYRVTPCSACICWCSRRNNTVEWMKRIGIEASIKGWWIHVVKLFSLCLNSYKTTYSDEIFTIKKCIFGYNPKTTESNSEATNLVSKWRPTLVLSFYVWFKLVGYKNANVPIPCLMRPRPFRRHVCLWIHLTREPSKVRERFSIGVSCIL